MFVVTGECDKEGILVGDPTELRKPAVGVTGEGILDGVEAGMYPDVGGICEGKESRGGPWEGVCMFMLMPTLLGVVGSGPRTAWESGHGIWGFTPFKLYSSFSTNNTVSSDSLQN